MLPSPPQEYTTAYGRVEWIIPVNVSRQTLCSACLLTRELCCR